MKCCAKREVERGLTLSFTRDFQIRGDGHANTETVWGGGGEGSQFFFFASARSKIRGGPLLWIRHCKFYAGSTYVNNFAWSIKDLCADSLVSCR